MLGSVDPILQDGTFLTQQPIRVVGDVLLIVLENIAAKRIAQLVGQLLRVGEDHVVLSGSEQSADQEASDCLGGPGQRDTQHPDMPSGVRKNTPDAPAVDIGATVECQAIRSGIAAEELKQPMAGRELPGHERRPGRSGQGWVARFERPMDARFENCPQIGKMALRHPGA